MSSTATAIRATSRQHSYRLSPTPSSRSQPKQIPDLLAGHQQSSNLCSRNGGHASQSHMTSAAYHGQGPVTCETNAPSRQTFSSMSAPFERSWSTQRSTQNWQGDYPATYTVQPGQQRSLQYQPSQQLPVQIKQTSSSATSSHASRQATRTSTPTSTCSASGASTSGDSQSMVMHSLQLPSRISPKGGNLADFAAQVSFLIFKLRVNTANQNHQVTCLFWFESPQALEAAEKIRVTPQERALPRLSANAVPTESFRKWVRTILSTTQVTQNVIILALMFVYRLKMTNPSVRGRPGSEYRLLTVALMLGNKCKCSSKSSLVLLKLTIPQFSMTIPTPTRRGLKFRAFRYRRSTLWKSNSSATCDTLCWLPASSGRSGLTSCLATSFSAIELRMHRLLRSLRCPRPRSISHRLQPTRVFRPPYRLQHTSLGSTNRGQRLSTTDTHQ